MRTFGHIVDLFVAFLLGMITFSCMVYIKAQNKLTRKEYKKFEKLYDKAFD